MFEKEVDYRKARKESKDRITKVIKVWSAEEETIHDEGFQKGAEFGYNKANKELQKAKQIIQEFLELNYSEFTKTNAVFLHADKFLKESK